MCSDDHWWVTAEITDHLVALLIPHAYHYTLPLTLSYSFSLLFIAFRVSRFFITVTYNNVIVNISDDLLLQPSRTLFTCQPVDLVSPQGDYPYKNSLVA